MKIMEAEIKESLLDALSFVPEEKNALNAAYERARLACNNGKIPLLRAKILLKNEKKADEGKPWLLSAIEAQFLAAFGGELDLFLATCEKLSNESKVLGYIHVGIIMTRLRQEKIATLHFNDAHPLFSKAAKGLEKGWPTLSLDHQRKVRAYFEELFPAPREDEGQTSDPEIRQAQYARHNVRAFLLPLMQERQAQETAPEKPQLSREGQQERVERRRVPEEALSP